MTAEGEYLCPSENKNHSEITFGNKVVLSMSCLCVPSPTSHWCRNPGAMSDPQSAPPAPLAAQPPAQPPAQLLQIVGQMMMDMVAMAAMAARQAATQDQQLALLRQQFEQQTAALEQLLGNAAAPAPLPLCCQ